MTSKCGKNKKVAHEAQSQQFVTYHIKRNWFPLVHLKITTQSGWYTVCAIFKSRKIFYFLVTIKVSPRRLWFLRAVSINIINVNESDPRSNEHYLSSIENKAWKFQSCAGFEPIFTTFIFTTAQVVFITARITFIHVFIRSSKRWFSYIHSRLILSMLVYEERDIKKVSWRLENLFKKMSNGLF